MVGNFIFYLFFSVVFNQSYKVVTRTSKKDGSLTILLQFLTGTIILLLVPFFEIKFPSDIRIYLFLVLSILFYAIKYRLNTTIIKGIEISSFSILSQLNIVFMILIGLFFFKEPIIISKVIGTLLIIFSNILVFFTKKSLKINKYVILGILSNLSMAIAVSLDVSISNQFNIPMYIAITFITPAIVLFLFERQKISYIQSEFRNGNKKLILITAISWAINAITSLRLYLLGEITTVAPLCSLTVILNVLAGFIFLKERNNILKKIVAGILIIISVFLIKI